MRLIALSLLLVGCANVQPPLSVQAVPNDCANQQAIVRYLLQLADTPKQPLESRDDYEQSRKSYRARAWHVRYNCNPA